MPCLLEAGGEGAPQLTPWFRLITETFLYKWWQSLDRLDDHKDTKTIHSFL